MENRCVVCGVIIPEGRYVCPNCEAGYIPMNPRLYPKLIAPILYYPGQSYEPKKKYIENPVAWYPEEMEHELKVKYEHLNTLWDILGFEERYEVYT